MRNNHHVSFTTALLSIALLTSASSAAIAQGVGNTTVEPGPAPTIPANRDSAIEEAAQTDRNDNCLEGAPGVARTPGDGSTGAASAPDTLGTDARIDTSRVNCLDEHNDAPHQDNLRLENPNTGAPSDRTDIIIDEDQRNSTND